MDNLSLTFENMGVQLPYNMEAEQAVLGEEMPDPAQDAPQENE